VQKFQVNYACFHILVGKWDKKKEIKKKVVEEENNNRSTTWRLD